MSVLGGARSRAAVSASVIPRPEVKLAMGLRMEQTGRWQNAGTFPQPDSHSEEWLKSGQKILTIIPLQPFDYSSCIPVC